MTAKDRVQKHRAHLKEQGCGRLDVSMSVALIDQLRQMARYKGVPVRSAIQDALEVQLAEYRYLLAECRRLIDEQARVVKLVGIPEYQPQIVEYKRQLVAYNERRSRFQGTTHPGEVRVR